MELQYIILASAIFFLAIVVLVLSVRPRRRYEEAEETMEKPRLEFSKLIMLLVFATYFMGFIIGVWCVLKDPTQLQVLLAYTGAPALVAIGFYAWKAKAENCVRLQQKSPEGTSIADLANIPT